MTFYTRKLEIVFYRSNNGSEPTREWLKSLPKSDKKIIGEDIKTVQFGWPLGMPLVQSLGQGLWEVRTKLPSRRVARILFFIDCNTMILVNSFMKKTQKIPKFQLDLALKRKKQYEGK